MFARHCIRGLVVIFLGVALIGCSNPQGLDSVQVAPATQSLAVGQTAQLTATGTYGNAKHLTTQNITSGVAWASANTSVATVSDSGLVTAVSAGTTTITASANAYNGAVSSSATVTIAGSTAAASLVSLQIIPNSITVGNLQDTGNFLAIGTFSTAPFIRDLTNSVTWISSSPDVFPVSSNSGSTPNPTNPGASGGVVTAYGSGNAVITAEAKDNNGNILGTATGTFNCPLVVPSGTNPGSCYPGSQAPALKATITVYNEGINTTDWTITAPSATGTPDVIHCGPGWTGGGGSVCEAAYPIDPTGATIYKITLKAQGGAFGGWSWTCLPSDATSKPLSPPTITATGPNYCTVTISPNNPNVTVGAIFN